MNNKVFEFNYMLLSRLQQDCEYFLNYGKGSLRSLYFGDIDVQISKMKNLWNEFPNNLKPEWLSFEQIENYEKEMLNYKN